MGVQVGDVGRVPRPHVGGFLDQLSVVVLEEMVAAQFDDFGPPRLDIDADGHFVAPRRQSQTDGRLFPVPVFQYAVHFVGEALDLGVEWGAVDAGRSYRWIPRDLGISENTVADIVKRHRADSLA